MIFEPLPNTTLIQKSKLQSTMCNRIFNKNIQQVTHFVTTHDIHLFYFIQN